MSIVGGLVQAGTKDHELAGSRRHAVAEWMVRHAWRIILGCSLAFWAALAALLVFG